MSAAYTDVDDANTRVDELEKELTDVQAALESTDSENSDARELLDTIRQDLTGLADTPLGTVQDVVDKLVHDIERVL